jgi:hypothetical protein
MRIVNKRLARQLLVAFSQRRGSTSSRHSGDIYTITPRDLLAADKKVRRCEREWEQAGTVRVTQPQVAGALQEANVLQRRFSLAKAQSRQGITLRYLSLVRVFVLTGLPRFGKTLIIFFAAAICSALTMLLSPVFFPTFGAAIVGALIITALGSGLTTAAVFLLWPTESKRQSFQELQRQWRERRAHVETLRPVVARAWTEHKVLRRRWILTTRLDKARRRRDELNALLTSLRYQLIHTDWRSMRGEEFELFLSHVFEMLGFQVQVTKASGDQGVDLVVMGKGSRIAVQAKGYASSVGNESVQAVVAGKAFYNCDSCVVITNSRFTSGARNLAEANECQLIDGTQITDLIEGQYY